MAGRKQGGNGKVANITVEILRDIREELRELRRHMDQGLNEVRQEVGELRQEVSQLRGRFDHFLDFAGQRYQDHENRIRALELQERHQK